MSWMINLIISIFFAMVFSTSMFFSFWILYKIFSKKLDAKTTCILLRIILLSFLSVILVAFFLYIYYAVQGDMVILLLPIRLFHKSSLVFKYFIGLWSTGTGIASLLFFLTFWHFRKKIMCLNVEEDNIVILSELEKIKKILGLSETIKVYRNKNLFTPIVAGVLKPYIILPLQEYSALDLSIIFVHELTHIKNKDLIYKKFVIIIKLIFWFNPLVYIFEKFFYEIMEYYCDEGSCSIGEIFFTKKQYFLTILNISIKQSPSYIDTSSLFENKKYLQRRSIHMKNYKDLKKRSGSIAGILSLIMIFSGSIITFAASNQAISSYQSWYDSNTTITIEEIQYTEDAPLIEYLSDNPKPNNTKKMKTSYLANGDIIVHITISAGEIYESNSINKKNGQKIRFQIAASPSSASIKAGLFGPKGTAFVRSTGSINHTFTIKEDGNYIPFIENLGSSDVTIMGYIYPNG